MPETSAMDLRSTLDSISARAKQLTVVPMPQPGHQMCGIRSVRRKGSAGLVRPIIGLAQVQFGYDEGASLLREFLNAAFGEGPHGDEAQLADTEALLASHNGA